MSKHHRKQPLAHSGRLVQMYLCKNRHVNVTGQGPQLICKTLVQSSAVSFQRINFGDHIDPETSICSVAKKPHCIFLYL